MINECQMPSLNKETGEIISCKNTDVEVFNYQGKEFYFCSKHYDLFSQNIDNLYNVLKKEMKDLYNI